MKNCARKLEGGEQLVMPWRAMHYLSSHQKVNGDEERNNLANKA